MDSAKRFSKPCLHKQPGKFKPCLHKQPGMFEPSLLNLIQLRICSCQNVGPVTSMLMSRCRKKLNFSKPSLLHAFSTCRTRIWTVPYGDVLLFGHFSNLCQILKVMHAGNICTPSVLNYKSFQKIWRVKVFQVSLDSLLATYVLPLFQIRSESEWNDWFSLIRLTTYVYKSKEHGVPWDWSLRVGPFVKGNYLINLIRKKSIFDHSTLASVWFWPSNSKTGYL